MTGSADGREPGMLAAPADRVDDDGRKANRSSRPQDVIDGLLRRAQVREVAAGGVTVRWYGFGDPAAPALVLLHGGHGSAWHWVRNIDALSRPFRLWVPDMPGYGGSDRPADKTLSTLVEATIASLDVVIGRDRSVMLAGFSFGALVSASIATRRANVTRLAVLGPGGHGGPRRPRGELLHWRSAAAGNDPEALAAVMRENLWLHMLHTRDAVDALAQWVHTDACLHTRFRSRDLSRGGLLIDLLREYPGPVLGLWGEQDVTCDPAWVIERLSSRAGELRVRLAAGAGHWVQYDAAHRVNAELTDWFRSTPEGTRARRT